MCLGGANCENLAGQFGERLCGRVHPDHLRRPKLVHACCDQAGVRLTLDLWVCGRLDGDRVDSDLGLLPESRAGDCAVAAEEAAVRISFAAGWLVLAGAFSGLL